jgi:hypothetical protein
MTKQRIITEESIRKNPGVDPLLLEAALRLREQLAALGLRRESGYRLVHPMNSRPADVNGQRRKFHRVMAQAP